MGLSNDLISQFVKVTKDSTKQKKESTGYGTVVVYDDLTYVRLDGSELLTPVSTTTELKQGERVSVTIKNHEAIANGNLSSPSASGSSVDAIRNDVSQFGIILADKASIEELSVEIARINSLVADNVTIKDKITANEGYISDLQVDNMLINESLVVIEADIKKLDSEKASIKYLEANYATVESLRATDVKIYNLQATYGDFQKLVTNSFEAVDATIKSLDTTYANIDFSNIGKAAIEYFFAQSGLIKNVIVGDQQITGELVGVTIRGDLIEGNTIVADKLVVKGEDGLYYKLNTDGVTTETEQTDYNSLNGQVIRAKSITAEKIAVEDLVAFGATIANFHINTNSLYSGVKESVDNTTTGIYMDSKGQLALGDDSKYIKYYMDSDGNRRLEILADSFVFSSSNKSVETIIKETVDNIEIGGKNLIRNSITMIFPDYYFESESASVEGDYIVDELGNVILDEFDNKLIM